MPIAAEAEAYAYGVAVASLRIHAISPAGDVFSFRTAEEAWRFRVGVFIERLVQVSFWCSLIGAAWYGLQENPYAGLILIFILNFVALGFRETGVTWRWVQIERTVDYPSELAVGARHGRTIIQYQAGLQDWIIAIAAIVPLSALLLSALL